MHIKKYYTNDLEHIIRTNIFIAETTYARQPIIANMKMREKDIEKLESAIRQTCIDEKARAMIPVFANARSSEILTCLYDIFGQDKAFEVPILIDSPMATRCCNAYSELLEGEDAEKWRQVLMWKNVHFVQDSIESREWRESNCPVVVLASSGMLVKGRSTGWACSMLPKMHDRIIFCGYAADGSLASIIKEGEQKTITVSGKRCPNKCQVTNLLSFSSHCQRDSLLKYYGSVDCEKIILVHGETQGRIEFAKELQEEISKNNNVAKVVVAQRGYEINI